MARKVTTWNPAWQADTHDGESRFPAFRTIEVSDNHEHHPNAMESGECQDCGAFVCGLCGDDQHDAADGHDLSSPRYWGF